MERELKAGDVVRLKSSGPKMTATGAPFIGTSAKWVVNCAWFNEFNQLCDSDFSPESLKLVNPEL